MKKIQIIRAAIVSAVMPLAIIGVSHAIADPATNNTPVQTTLTTQTVTPQEDDSNQVKPEAVDVDDTESSVAAIQPSTPVTAVHVNDSDDATHQDNDIDSDDDQDEVDVAQTSDDSSINTHRSSHRD